jgi:ketosteroid isomerase-like protein
MKKGLYVVTLLAAVAAAVVMAAPLQDEDALIALDKQWGEAGMRGDKAGVGKLIADDAVDVEPNGILDKSQSLAAVEPVDDPNAMYEAGDYQVKMLGADIAIMTHSTPDHYSLHVWQKQGGTWLVVATASVPKE